MLRWAGEGAACIIQQLAAWSKDGFHGWLGGREERKEGVNECISYPGNELQAGANLRCLEKI